MCLLRLSFINSSQNVLNTEHDSMNEIIMNYDECYGHTLCRHMNGNLKKKASTYRPTFWQDNCKIVGHVLSFHLNTYLLSAFGPIVYMFADIWRSRVGNKLLLSINDAHFTCTFINTDPSVVPDILLELHLYISTCYSWWSHKTHMNTRCQSSFESFHPIVKLPMAHAVTAMLRFHSSVNFLSF